MRLEQTSNTAERVSFQCSPVPSRAPTRTSSLSVFLKLDLVSILTGPLAGYMPAETEADSSESVRNSVEAIMVEREDGG